MVVTKELTITLLLRRGALGEKIVDLAVQVSSVGTCVSVCVTCVTPRPNRYIGRMGESPAVAPICPACQSLQWEGT